MEEAELSRSFKWWVPTVITIIAAILIIGVAFVIKHHSKTAVAPTASAQVASLNIPAGNCSNNSDQLYLTPTSFSVNKNQTINLTICSNSMTEPVNAIEADINYPASKLTLLGVSDIGSAFSIRASTTNNIASGLAKITRATIQPLTNNQPVAVVSFKANKSGNAQVSFNRSSLVLSSKTNTNIISLTAGTTVDIH